MTALTIQLPDDIAQQLKAVAKQQGRSLNKLFEQLSVQTIANWDVENRFKARAAQGNNTEALAILDMLDAKDCRA